MRASSFALHRTLLVSILTLQLLLCAPLLAQSAALPPPQRDALQIAFGSQDGPAPHPLLIGLATLMLLSGAAGELPTAGVGDDGYWLDHASAQVLSASPLGIAA